MSEITVLLAGLTILTTGICVHLCARLWGPRRLFLVPLYRVLTVADRARARRLVFANAALALAALTGLLALPGSLAAGIVATQTLSAVGLLIAAMHGARRQGAEAPPGRFAVPLAAQPSVLGYLSRAPSLANAVLIACSAVAFALIQRRLSQRAPLHWNGREIDRVGDPAGLWIFLGIMLFQACIGLLVVYGVSRERWALPEREQELYVALQRQRRGAIVRLVEATMLGINAGTAVIWLGIAWSSLPGNGWLRATAIVAGTVVMSLGTLAPLALHLGKLMGVQSQLRELAGTDVLGTRASGWRFSGLVYYAPEDPALFIPKRMGIGQTLNFARPGAWAVLLLVLAAPLVLVLGTRLLAG